MAITKQPVIKTLVLLGSLSISQLAHANLLSNGSFELGAFAPSANGTMSLPAASTTITGWTVTGDVAAWIGSPNPWSLSAAEGNLFLDLTDYTAGAPFAGLTQNIATVVGQAYTLSFDLGSSSKWGRPSAIQASAAGTSQTFTSANSGGDSDWKHVSMPFTATATTTTISLLGTTGNNYIGLDNVSVELGTILPAPISATDIINIQGYTDGVSTGSGADIYNYPVAPGTVVTLQNPVLVDFPAGDYQLSDAWGQSGALFDTWNFQSSAAGSWASHYVVATPNTDGNYKILLDVVSNLEPTCKNHYCAWDTQEQARDAFLATPAALLHLDKATTVAFASADYYLPDNLGGISIKATAITPNQAPLANAGIDISASKDSLIHLDGSASSDPEGATLTYNWTQSAGPAIALSAANVSNPSFTPTVIGTYTFSLVVSDGSLSSNADTITVEVLAPPAITANPGLDRTAAIGDIVKLQGNATSSKGSKNIKYRWQQTGGPQVWNNAKKSKNTVFTPQLPGTYTFSLIAYDRFDTSNAAIVTITVNPSITLVTPNTATVWQVGKRGEVNWTVSGINAKVKLALIGSLDGGNTRYWINKSVAASRKSYAFKIKNNWKTNNAFVDVCLIYPAAKKTPPTCAAVPGVFVIH